MKTLCCLLLSLWCVNGICQTTRYSLSNISCSTPCRLSLIDSELTYKSYSCSCEYNGQPVNYRISIDQSEYAKYYTAQSLYKTALQSNPPVQNLKYTTIQSRQAVQYDESIYIDGTSYKGRTVMFPYKSEAYSIMYISTPQYFDVRFAEFINTLTFK